MRRQRAESILRNVKKGGADNVVLFPVWLCRKPNEPQFVTDPLPPVQKDEDK